MSGLVALPWAWAAAAVLLAIAEVIVPGYILLGFAIGAAGVAGLLALGVGPMAASLPVTLVVFALLSLGAWLAMRRVFRVSGGSVKTFDRDINED